MDIKPIKTDADYRAALEEIETLILDSAVEHRISAVAQASGQGATCAH